MVGFTLCLGSLVVLILNFKGKSITAQGGKILSNNLSPPLLGYQLRKYLNTTAGPQWALSHVLGALPSEDVRRNPSTSCGTINIARHGEFCHAEITLEQARQRFDVSTIRTSKT